MRHVQIWVLVLIAGAGVAEAQTRATTGDLRVITVDEGGGALPAVRLQITSPDTGLARNTETNGEGQVVVSALPVGRYALRAEASGFRTVALDDVDIGLGTISELRITMRLASIDTTVDVVATIPLVDVQRSAIATMISDEQIATLPIDRRNYISFAVLAPGVSTDRTPEPGAGSDLGLCRLRSERPRQQHHGRRPRQQRRRDGRRPCGVQPGCRARVSSRRSLVLRRVRQSFGRRRQHRDQERDKPDYIGRFRRSFGIGR